MDEYRVAFACHPGTGLATRKLLLLYRGWPTADVYAYLTDLQYGNMRRKSMPDRLVQVLKKRRLARASEDIALSILTRFDTALQNCCEEGSRNGIAVKLQDERPRSCQKPRSALQAKYLG